MRKISTLLMLFCAFVGSAWAQAVYTPGARTTTLEAGKKYFISVATWYNGDACTNLLYNNGGTLAKSSLMPSQSVTDEAYLFTVEEVGAGYLAYIKNSEGKYLQADNLAAADGKTAVYVIPYAVAKAVCCGNDVDACDEAGNKIAYANITAETPIVSVQKNADYTDPDNRNGWRYIGGLSAGTNWCTAFAFYEALDASEAIVAKKAALNAKIQEAEALLTTAGFSYTGGAFNLQVNDSESAYYLSSNADQNTGGGANDGAGIAGLIDGKINDPYYFHTRWGGTNPGEAHYVQVDLGAGNEVDEFVFNYDIRHAGGNSGNTSPAPTVIEVYGGNTADAVNNLITTVKSTDEVNPLLAYTALGQNWNSGTITAGEEYRYLRFVVTESNGPGGKTFGGYYFFCMAEFGLAAPLKLNVTNETYKSRAEHLYKLSTAVAEAKVVVEGAEMGAMDACVANLTQKVSNVNTTYPFELTTNDADPVVYALKSGRGDAYWYTYDSSDGKIALSAYTAAQTQLWYFKETLDAEGNCVLQLFPYTGEGKAMSYENTENGASKVVAKDLNTAGWTNYWLLVAGSNGKYALQTYNKQNYLSNNGGTANKMGMWNAGPDADGGTAIYFVSPAEELQNLIAAAEGLIECKGLVGGVANSSVDALQSAINTAKDNLAVKNYSVDGLKSAISSIEIVLPETGKFYVLKNSYTNKYLGVADGAGLRAFDAATMGQVFTFTAAGEGAFYLKSVERASYLSTAPGHGGGQASAAAFVEGGAKAVTISNLGKANQVSLTPNGGATLHHDTNYGTIVGWNAGVDSKSAWIISEVNIEDYAHTVAVGEAGWATLVLGYNATIPAGVTAYAVTDAEGSATLAPVTDAIPANEAVLVKANAGNYDFKFTETEATVATNLLKGTVFDTNVAEEAYVLGYVGEEGNKEVGFYTATLNQAEGTAFKNNAFKAYLPKTGVSSTLRFNFGGTTAIESVLNNGIDANAAIYDLSGRRVEKAVKGIYIQNGKKIIVK